MAETTTPQPFRIEVTAETLDWITQRVQNARIVPDVEHPEGKEWADGVPNSVMTDLVEYWRTSYDWRKVEAKLNSTYNMFTLDIPEGNEVIKLHFVHHRSERADAIPLLFAHGWPGNFTEVFYILLFMMPALTDDQLLSGRKLAQFDFANGPYTTGIPRNCSYYSWFCFLFIPKGTLFPHLFNSQF